MPEIPELSKSAKLFQERRIPEHRETRRIPTPRSNFDSLIVHNIPLDLPFLTGTVALAQNDNPPDAHETKSWPSGEAELT